MASKGRPVMTNGPFVRWAIAGYMILAVAVVLGLYLSYHATQHVNDTASCISGWANATTNRNALLLRLSTERTDRLDQLIRDVVDLPRSRAKFRVDLFLYIDASDHYRAAVKSHPIPEPPSVRC